MFPMFKDRYGDKFGFTEAETKELIDHHHVEYDSITIKRWYNSYSAGGCIHLYNPWSIVSLCNENKLESYWVETGMLYLFFFTVLTLRV